MERMLLGAAAMAWRGYGWDQAICKPAAGSGQEWLETSVNEQLSPLPSQDGSTALLPIAVPTLLWWYGQASGASHSRLASV